MNGTMYTKVKKKNKGNIKKETEDLELLLHRNTLWAVMGQHWIKSYTSFKVLRCSGLPSTPIHFVVLGK
jgi:hypothetical protein